MLQATYDKIVTIDADLENPPQLIPKLAELLKNYHIVHASRNRLPRISEKIAAATIGRVIGVKESIRMRPIWSTHFYRLNVL